MNTLSNERLEEIASGDSIRLITVSEAVAMARELLALRQREAAVPDNVIGHYQGADGKHHPIVTLAAAQAQPVEVQSPLSVEHLTSVLRHAPLAPSDSQGRLNNPDKWIPCSERMPEEGGRYLCYVEEINSLGRSHYQWNCSWNGEEWGGEALSGRVTHWMPLPAAPGKEG